MIQCRILQHIYYSNSIWFYSRSKHHYNIDTVALNLSHRFLIEQLWFAPNAPHCLFFVFWPLIQMIFFPNSLAKMTRFGFAIAKLATSRSKWQKRHPYRAKSSQKLICHAPISRQTTYRDSRTRQVAWRVPKLWQDGYRVPCCGLDERWAICCDLSARHVDFYW